jgi:DNA-binding transcriptional ArsR family regulator
MPLSVNDTFDIPYYATPIRVALEPARSAVHSLLMLTRTFHQAGPSDWVMDTIEAMSPEERKAHNLVLLGLHYVVMPKESWNSFPAYVDHLEAQKPEALRDKMMAEYERLHPITGYTGPLMDLSTALASEENYLAYLRQRFMPDHIDEKIEREAYRYVMDPPALQRLVVDHLRHMWDHYLSSEWERMRPVLQEIVRAYLKVDFKGKSFLEAGRLITGQDLDEARWEHSLEGAKRVVFVPNAHVGPYMPRRASENGEVIAFFSPHLPDWMAKDTPDLTRTEIAIRLGALADDTRLRILRYIAEHGETRSQEIMEALYLSQSAASRHLTQLSAAGFINDRRCEGAKCYALNPERVTDTLQAIASFLLVQEGMDHEYETPGS